MAQGIDFFTDLLPLKNKLFRWTLRLVQNREDAEDIVADVLAKAWEMRGGLTEVESLEQFLYATCKNKALDRIKSGDRQTVELDGTMTETLQSFKTPHDQLERSDQMQCLRQLMAKLPAKQQEAIHLREIEEYSYQEIAQRMNESETNVKVLIHRARQTLKDAFLKYDNHGL